MNSESVLALRDWIADTAMSGAEETELLQGVCDRLCADGIDLMRGVMGVDTLHPVLEGRMFVWKRGAEAVRASEYLREQTAATTAKWNASPHAWMHAHGETQLRRRLEGSNAV